MIDYCEDCGCRVYNGSCVNCDEEAFIAEQQWIEEYAVPDRPVSIEAVIGDKTPKDSPRSPTDNSADNPQKGNSENRH